MHCWRSYFSIVLLLLLAVPAYARVPREKLAPYMYEDTKRLVILVEEAAALVEEKGTAAFPEFAIKGSRWLNRDYYIFIYDDQGTNVFHPVNAALVGKDLIQLKDMHGKPVIQRIVNVAKLPEKDAADWVFYLWEDKTQLTPLWKSAYIRKAITPEGKVLLVGCGLYNIKIEKAFIKENVDAACALLLSDGKAAAFKAFRDPASVFVFLETYVFVLDPQGRTLVDPAYPTQVGRDLTGFQDAMGIYVIREVLAKLQTRGDVWSQYMWPRPGAWLPSRKLLYVRKVTVNGEEMIVGSDFFLATPIWMKM